MAAFEFPSSPAVGAFANGYIWDGEKWTRPATAGNVFSLKDFGAVGDGVTNASAARDAVLAAVVAAGGGTIFCPKGTYLFTTATPPYSVPITWQGEPGTVFKCVASTETTFFAPTGSLSAVTTSQYDVPVGKSYLPLFPLIAGLAEGDLVAVLYSDSRGFLHTVTLPVWATSVTGNGQATLNNGLSVTSGSGDITVNYPGHGRTIGVPVVIEGASYIAGASVNGFYKITAVIDANNFKVAQRNPFGSTVANSGGATILVTLFNTILSGMIPFAIIAAASTKQVYKVNAIKGGGFRDIEFDATGSTASVCAITATRTAYGNYARLRFKGFKAAVFDGPVGHGLMLNLGYANTVEDVFAEDSGSGGANDISLYHQTRLSGRGIRSVRAFGFGPGLYFCTECHIDDIMSDQAAERGVKLAGSVDCTIDLIDQANAGFTGVGFSGAAIRNRINVLRTRGAHEYSLWFANEYSTDNWFGWVVAVSTLTGTDVGIFPNDTGIVIENLVTGTTPYNGGGAKIYRLNGVFTP